MGMGCDGLTTFILRRKNGQINKPGLVGVGLSKSRDEIDNYCT